MIYQNTQNLPDALYQAIANDPYKKGGDFSASELPGPPQIRVLKQRYDKQIVQDVADLIYPLIGNNTHYILQRMGVKNALQEEQLTYMVNGYKVSGRPDDYMDKILSDYKVTTRYVLIDGAKPEWKAQLNIYAFLLEKTGFPVESARVCAMFRDWSKIQALKNPDYPKYQVAILPIVLWDLNETGAYIARRIDAHVKAENLPDDLLPECTPEERWEKPTIYAVKKKGRKSSVRNLTSLKHAQEYIEKNNLDTAIHSIEKRIGESTRCEYYCIVKDFCQQYKKMKED